MPKLISQIPDSEIQVIENKKVSLNLPLNKIIQSKEGEVLKKRDVKRLQSQLIRSFIKKEVDSENAKCLTYLLNSYIASYDFLSSDLDFMMD